MPGQGAKDRLDHARVLASTGAERAWKSSVTPVVGVCCPLQASVSESDRDR
jgi:hypothetical protein